MIRCRSLVLWGSLALCACGKKFEADGASGASSTAGASGGGEPSGGAGHAGGSDNGGDAGQAEVAGTAAGGAAAGAGGLPAVGGLPGIGGLPGVGGGIGEADAGEVPPISTVGLALWLRADRGVIVTGGHVSQWLDQSGNQMDALQTAGNARPTLLARGLNGLPTLDFDGIVQYLRLPDGFADFNKGLSAFVVSKATVTDGSCASTVELSNGSEIDDIEFGYWKQGWQYEVFDRDFAGGMIDPKQPELYSVLHRATQEVVMRLNGNQANTASFPLPVTKVRQENFIGHSLYADCKYYQGQISEVVLYNRIVTDKELLTIEGYLQQHWAL